MRHTPVVSETTCPRQESGASPSCQLPPALRHCAEIQDFIPCCLMKTSPASTIRFCLTPASLLRSMQSPVSTALGLCHSGLLQSLWGLIVTFLFLKNPHCFLLFWLGKHVNRRETRKGRERIMACDHRCLVGLIYVWPTQKMFLPKQSGPNSSSCAAFRPRSDANYGHEVSSKRTHCPRQGFKVRVKFVVFYKVYFLTPSLLQLPNHFQPVWTFWGSCINQEKCGWKWLPFLQSNMYPTQWSIRNP